MLSMPPLRFIIALFRRVLNKLKLLTTHPKKKTAQYFILLLGDIIIAYLFHIYQVLMYLSLNFENI